MLHRATLRAARPGRLAAGLASLSSSTSPATAVPSAVSRAVSSTTTTATPMRWSSQAMSHTELTMASSQRIATQRRFCASAGGVPKRDDVRNLAVIAHVDHGKTTLVDGLLKHSGTLSDARNRVMDSNDQEKERGITILAKNTAIVFPDGRRVNIVDTPGHLDFSGEVERALQMVEGFVLLVDAAEGVKPGTRYVLRKALTLGLHPIVCLNKIDKEDGRIEQVVSQIEDLFLEIATEESQLDIFFLYGSGRDGYFNPEPKKGGDLQPLFNAMFNKVPAPTQKTADEPFQMLVGQVDEVDGKKVAIGRIFKGKVSVGDVVKVCLGDQQEDALVKDVRLFRGIDREPVKDAAFGDVVWMVLQEPQQSKIPLSIGATLCDRERVDPCPYRPPDKPTVTLKLLRMDAPWKGKESEGNPIAKLAALRERLRRELMVNTALQIENLDKDEITLHGRGPLHLSVLIESLRREGFEFELKAPSIVQRVIDGEKCEPYERITLDYPVSDAPEIVTMMNAKNAEMVDMDTKPDGRATAEFTMPVRFMTDLSTKFNRMTGGRGVLNHVSDGYKPVHPVSTERETGTLIALEEGEAQTYALAGLAQQGRFFVNHGDKVYYGQVVGENLKVKFQDTPVNVTKRNEQIGGFRANVVDKGNKRGSDFDSTKMGLEECMAWVSPEELITVTPKSIRMRRPGFAGKTTNRKNTKNNK